MVEHSFRKAEVLGSNPRVGFFISHAEDCRKQGTVTVATIFERSHIDLRTWISNVFLPGHRMRLEISSSNFPRAARNLNTGGPNYNESKPRS